MYWNVNARTEFSYWQDGERVVSFDLPDQRAGSDPDRLLADMNCTVLPLVDSSRTMGAYYAGLLALAERITGIHLGPDFLHRPSMLVGFFDEDGDRDDSDDGADDPASLADSGRLSGTSFDAGGGVRSPAEPDWASLPAGWEPNERRLNEAAFADIPTDRLADVPARIARHACESVEIADRYPIDEILDDLEHARQA